ncbi:MAG: InlB B-repeat-containing protein, partial [Firmicutes bacterium]|nr:InlB B-repeat-containing protein [Bacillota bacterium]
MKEKLQNIMQNLSRKRLIAIALVLALLVTSIPLSMLGDNTAYAKVGPNYGAVIGNSAKFNVSNFPDALVTNDPYNFDMNSWEDAGDVNNRVDFSNKDSLEDIANSYGELPLVITNYYHDEEQHSLWYKVEAGPGYELPSRIAEKPWVYQNDTRNYDDSGKTKGMPDALLIYETGATYVFDEEGNAISELDFYELDAHKLYAETTLQGSVDYQWQICSDGEWINIYKEDKKEFKLSWGMVKGLLDESLKVKFRVVATSTNKTIESAPVTVNFVQPVEGDSITYDLRNNSIENRQMLMETGENVSDTVTVTVKFIYGENGEQLDDDKVYTIQKNADLKDTFKLPEIAGYNAYLEDDTETIYTEYTIDEAVTGNKTITFKYWPAKVNYTVIYYWQNVEDDNYTEKERYTTQGFTGSLTEAEDKYYPGLYQLLYEEVPIASDGSTVIEVYYDRNYYKMTFDLDGGYGVQPIYARYGTEVNVSNPTKAGYEFVGWDDITNVGDGTPDGIENALPKNVPAYHTAFKAIWKATDNAKLTIV